ncbi:ABC transporter substrate-binding protein [Yinghuangia sp. ASG 101]|uniref:ABC transporter substrate-binding protein n=1 Tax=Yinghuangia sp. ASG 101 TaxID=2896848 RepID=UPI001E5DEE75|nr:ABC transporter substrate-binding protein [Yinghuangia sp. ASG 101]UGQ12408.1 ABC transporter substrate-binding protein [Yinghuangia sp. ASG 101]
MALHLPRADFRRRQGSRPRRFRPLVGLFTAGLLAAATACGGGSSGGTPGAGLTVAIESQPECLDPAVSALDVTAVVDRNVFDSLVDMAPDGSFRPWLAQSWEISPDGLEYTFHLRPGVTFHDGTPLDAAAVKASLDHVVDPATKSVYAAGLIKGYTGATAVDADTVVIRLAAPQAALLQALSTAYLGIQSPKSIAENAANLCAQPVGSGPFRFGSWARNQNIVLERNPGYAWAPDGSAHTGPARADRLTFSIVPETSVRFGALTSNQADVITGLPPDRVATLEGGSGKVLRAEAPGVGFTLFLNPLREPLADERVRTAFARSLDLDALVKSVYFGEYRRAWSPLGPTTVGYDPTLVGTWPYDPALANRLLDQAGWTGRDSEGYRTKNGERLTLRWPYATQMLREQRDILAQGIQAQAKEAGFHVDYVGQDTGTFTKDVLGRDLDINAISNVRAEPDVLRTFFASDQTPQKAGGNVFAINDPQLDRFLNDATATTDPAARAALYANAQRYIIEHALAVPVYVPVQLVGTASQVSGVTFDAQGYPRFYGAGKGSSA